MNVIDVDGQIHKVDILFGNLHTENQLDLFERLATKRQRRRH